MVLRAVGRRTSTCSFGDVPDDGFRGPHELIGSFGVSPRKIGGEVEDQCEEFDGTLVDVEALKTEHGEAFRPLAGNVAFEIRSRLPSTRDVNVHVAVHVNVGVNVNVNDAQSFKLPLVEGIPATRGSIVVAALSAFAKDLKQILRGQAGAFTRNLTEKLLTFALGRGLEPYDRRTVEDIVHQMEQNNYRFSTLVMEIVKSKPFGMRSGEPGGKV